MSTPLRIVAMPRPSCTSAMAPAASVSGRRVRIASTITPSTRILASQRWMNWMVVPFSNGLIHHGDRSNMPGGIQ